MYWNIYNFFKPPPIYPTIAAVTIPTFFAILAGFIRLIELPLPDKKINKSPLQILVLIRISYIWENLHHLKQQLNKKNFQINYLF